MNETTPRPMPTLVCVQQRRKPVNLRAIFEALSPEQQRAIFDAFLAERLGAVGDPWIPMGRAGKEQRASQRAKSFRTDVFRGIEFALSVEDWNPRPKEGIGDGERSLARVIDPYWLAWWESSNNAKRMMVVGGHVLSDPSLRWLAAQYARTVFGGVTPKNRGVMLAAIETAEGYALGRVSDRQLMDAERTAESAAKSVSSDNSSSAADWASFWASATGGVKAGDGNIAMVASKAASAAANCAPDWVAALGSLANVTRQVMAHCAPSLVPRQ